MSKTVTGGRLAYADLLRAVAMLAVIIVHLAGSQLGNVPVGSAEFHVLNAYDGLTHWCVPVFIMLSGMFLLDPKHSLSSSKLFFGHILRMLVALVVWGTAYALVTQVSAAGLSWESVKAALWQVLQGKTHFHLWFLYMIVGLYLITPHPPGLCAGGRPGRFPLVLPAVLCVCQPAAHSAAAVAQ